MHFEIYNPVTKSWKYVGPIDAELAPRTSDPSEIKPIAIIGSCLEKYATEVRGLQKTELREVEEPQPGPSTGSASEKKGLSPSEWGERLGVLTRSLDEGEPIVLHCFENIPSDFSDMEETE